MTPHSTRYRLLVPALAALALSGCVHGHRALEVSHARHNQAVQARINEELLLNLVRLRYRDAPLFLRIGSVVTQFEFTASAGASGDLEEGGPGALGILGGVGVSENPTFTFTPLQDEDFVQRLLAPVDPEVVVLLQRSGWSLDRVLRVTMQQLGGLDNATSASGPTPGRAPEFDAFRRVSGALRALQAEGALVIGYESFDEPVSAAVPRSAVRGGDLVEAAGAGLRFAAAGTDGDRVRLTRTSRALVLRLAEEALDGPEVSTLVRELALTPGLSRYRLEPGGAPLPGLLGPPGQRDTIAFSTRSLLGSMFYLSQGIEVPAEHVERSLVTVTRDAAGDPFDWGRLAGDLLRVRSSSRQPRSAAVAVPYRGAWFWIDDADLDSKSTFALLVQLFSLQSGAATGSAPVLTLPVGR